MSTPLSDHFRSEVFREEALELLSELETSLLELEAAPRDQELVGQIFRALHTIKGSGAMYGFEAVSRFTHEFETAFDLVRSGKMEAGEKFVRLALRARDQILALLREHSGEGPADGEETRLILTELGRLTGLQSGAGRESSQAKEAGTPAAAPGREQEFHIVFRPSPDLLLQGANPLLLLRELKALGRTDVKMLSEEVPRFSELDPEKCYLGWDVHLWTRQSADAVRDVFIFVEDQCELKIEQVSPAREEQAGPRTAPGLVSSSIRVGAEKLDRLVNLVGELVTVQARLSGYASLREDAEMQFLAEEVERLTAELRDNSMSLRMVPLKSAFERLRRLVHDLARDLGKEVEFRTYGEETELDKSMIDQLHDPLVHLIRNSLDHGLEPPERRLAQGKSRQGVVRVSAAQSGTSVLIRVADDGGGLNRAAIRDRAVRLGLLAQGHPYSDQEICQMILAPGFSTAREVTSISGRGVGMDVVRSSVEAMRGSLEVESEEGVGTSITMRLPLTLAIIEGLLVRVGGSYFVLPLACVEECVDLAGAACGGRREMAVVRGELVPYLRLRTLFGMSGKPPELEQILVTRTERGRLGLVVDQVLGNHHTVIKSLGKFYRRVQEMSGATILGDGTVALILDVERVAQSHGRETALRKAG
jgi:two-component system chemotaxis sensor kinase CheA